MYQIRIKIDTAIELGLRQGAFAKKLRFRVLKLISSSVKFTDHICLDIFKNT